MKIDQQLKSKLAWLKCQKNMKLKQKWYRRNDYSKKWHFYWVITWKFLFSGGGGIDFWLGGNKNFVGGGSLLGGFPDGWEVGGEQIFGWYGGGGGTLPSRVHIHKSGGVHSGNLRKHSNFRVFSTKKILPEVTKKGFYFLLT